MWKSGTTSASVTHLSVRLHHQSVQRMLSSVAVATQSSNTITALAGSNNELMEGAMKEGVASGANSEQIEIFTITKS